MLFACYGIDVELRPVKPMDLVERQKRTESGLPRRNMATTAIPGKRPFNQGAPPTIGSKTPRSRNMSSPLRYVSGNRMPSITARRMICGYGLK